MPAVGVVNDLAGDEAGIVGCQEGDHGGRVRGLADAAEGERGVCLGPFAGPIGRYVSAGFRTGSWPLGSGDFKVP